MSLTAAGHTCECYALFKFDMAYAPRAAQRGRPAPGAVRGSKLNLAKTKFSTCTVPTS
eukprot:SAG31_NODE_1642_length_7657_cov_3.459402_1_plen_58_part_00